ncbi:hypothetical protein [Nocardiopsis dassonvillei]|uniref:hypothetical protein n=1 Tax=Nocardiopsis dassonvillei TaxID=2014 RepID=UPI00366D0562
MSTRTDWRTRLAATVAFIDHLLLQTDTLISACLDIRPLNRSLGAALGWLGRTWREHLSAARTRRHGPGRGVIAVVITRPSEETQTHD